MWASGDKQQSMLHLLMIYGIQRLDFAASCHCASARIPETYMLVCSVTHTIRKIRLHVTSVLSITARTWVACQQVSMQSSMYVDCCCRCMGGPACIHARYLESPLPRLSPKALTNATSPMARANPISRLLFLGLWSSVFCNLHLHASLPSPNMPPLPLGLLS